jgi:1,4-dihydroxy-2-naphthoate octaprenyltransferase
MPPRPSSLPEACFLATRPWSWPASLVPAALAVAVSWPRVASAADAALPVAGVVLLQSFGNLVNTYFDYAKGVDTPATADDRALVDGWLTQRQLAQLAAATLAGGIAALSGPIVALGAPVAALAAAGVALAFFYTAAPFSLKYWGAGDAVIFAAFGPLLSVGVAMAATRSAEVDPAVLAASLPIGLLTVAILHANNTRDMAADAAAGARTLAQALGFRGSYAFYVALFMWAYASAGSASLYTLCVAHGTTPARVAAAVGALLRSKGGALLAGGDLRFGALADPGGADAAALSAAAHTARAVGLLVAATLPWAAALCRRFRSRALRTLPQATAQLTLLFGATMISGLLPAPALARVVLAAVTAAACVGDVGAAVPVAAAAGPLRAVQLVAAGALAFGYAPHAAAAVLAATVLPVSTAAHAFWDAGFDAAGETVPLAAVTVGGAPSAASAAAAAAAAAPGTPAAVAKRGRSRAGSTTRQRRGTSAAAAPAVEGSDTSKAAATQVSRATTAAPAADAWAHYWKGVGVSAALALYAAGGW